MDPSKIIKFKELLSAINQFNGVNTPITYILITKYDLRYKKGISLYDLSNFDYLIAIGEYKWSCGNYINQSAKLIGFFNNNFELINYIPINESITLKDIKFTTYPSSFYNEYKPIFLCENKNGETVDVKLESNDGWSQEFINLFKQAKQL